MARNAAINSADMLAALPAALGEEQQELVARRGVATFEAVTRSHLVGIDRLHD